MRHFLFAWLKKQGIDDAMIRPFSGHESGKLLEIYSRLSITVTQGEYNKTMSTYPVKLVRLAIFSPTGIGLF